MAEHPLEPLTAEEFRQTAALLRSAGHVNDGFRFTSIELKEPPKADVKAWRPGHAGPADVVRGASSTVPRTRPTRRRST